MDVTPHEDEEKSHPEGHEDVVPSEPTEIQQSRRQGQHDRGDDRTRFADVVTEEIRQGHQCCSEQRVAKARYEIGVSQEPEQQSNQFNLEGAVHPGRVDIFHTLGELPGEMEMNGLVVVHGAVIQFPKPQPQRGSGQKQEGRFQPSKPDRKAEARHPLPDQDVANPGHCHRRGRSPSGLSENTRI